jgi:hypothetical protein
MSIMPHLLWLRNLANISNVSRANQLTFLDLTPRNVLSDGNFQINKKLLNMERRFKRRLQDSPQHQPKSETRFNSAVF